MGQDAIWGSGVQLKLPGIYCRLYTRTLLAVDVQRGVSSEALSRGRNSRARSSWPHTRGSTSQSGRWGWEGEGNPQEGVGGC